MFVDLLILFRGIGKCFLSLVRVLVFVAFISLRKIIMYVWYKLLKMVQFSAHLHLQVKFHHAYTA